MNVNNEKIKKVFPRDPFELERVRSTLANNHLLEKLRSTYSSGHSEIKNMNTGKFWDTKNDFIRTIENNSMAKDRINTSAKCVINLRPKKILSIGFGPANIEHLVHTKNNQISISGIEISKESINKAKKLIPNMKLYIGDLKDCIKQLKRFRFDCVLTCEVLEHIPPKKVFGFYRMVSQLLPNGGYFLVSIPLNENLEILVKTKNINPNAHVRVYTRELIFSELELAGFKVVKSQVFFAFNKYYNFKKLLTKLFSFGKKPNNILILAQKP